MSQKHNIYGKTLDCQVCNALPDNLVRHTRVIYPPEKGIKILIFSYNVRYVILTEYKMMNIKVVHCSSMCF